MSESQSWAVFVLAVLMGLAPVVGFAYCVWDARRHKASSNDRVRALCRELAGALMQYQPAQPGVWFGGTDIRSVGQTELIRVEVTVKRFAVAPPAHRPVSQIRAASLLPSLDELTRTWDKSR